MAIKTTKTATATDTYIKHVLRVYPDLLAACKSVMEEANMQLDADDPDDGERIELQHDTLRQIAAAIDKAEQTT